MNNSRFTRDNAFCFGLLALGAVAAIWRFWQPGVTSTADMLIGIYRVFELHEAWQYGIFYPRIGPNLNFGYGAPLFQFYPPLVSYGALAFYWAGLGFIHSTKAMFTLSLLIAASGMYLYARWLFSDRLAALLSAAVYLFAPYMLIVIYDRGAAAEGLALALLPWVFWLCHRLLYRDGIQNDFKSVVGASCAVALLMLAHNITTLFALAAIVVYIGLIALQARRLKPLFLVWVAIAGGLGLSGFYWIPALFELDYTRADVHLFDDTADITTHLVTWTGLFQHFWRFDYWGETRFRFSLWYGVMGGAALLVLPLQPQPRRTLLGIAGGLWLAILLLQIGAMGWMWTHFPLVGYIQFPWRLFGMASLCVAILAGSLLQLPHLTTHFRWAILVALLAVTTSLSLYNLRPALSPGWYEMDENEIGIIDLYERGRFGFSLFTDYTPRAMGVNSVDLARPVLPGTDTLPPLASAPTIQVIHENPVRMHMQVQAEAPFTLRAHRLFFPGWQFEIEGRRVETGPDGLLGLVSAELPAGEYDATLRFGQTPLRRMADTISLITVIGLLVGLGGFHTRRAIVISGLALLLFATVWLVRQRLYVELARSPLAAHVNFQDEIHLLGYHLPETAFHVNERIVLHLYWLVQKSPDANYKTFIHVTELDDSGTVLQGDSEPMLGNSPMTRWEPGEVIGDEYSIRLNDSIEPGRYRLLVGVYHPETVQNLAVREAPMVLPGDRVVLTEITVVHE